MDKFLAGLLCIIGLFSCSSGSTEEKIIPFETTEFSIAYPSGWELNKQPQMEFAANSPLEENDQFADNFNVVKQYITGTGIDLDKFTQISEGQINANLGKGAILESKRSGDHHTLVFKGPLEGRQLKWKQEYYIKNETAYILTYTAEEKSYDKYSDIASSIFNSFKLK